MCLNFIMVTVCILTIIFITLFGILMCFGYDSNLTFCQLLKILTIIIFIGGSFFTLILFPAFFMIFQNNYTIVVLFTHLFTHLLDININLLSDETIKIILNVSFLFHGYNMMWILKCCCCEWDQKHYEYVEIILLVLFLISSVISLVQNFDALDLNGDIGFLITNYISFSSYGVFMTLRHKDKLRSIIKNFRKGNVDVVPYGPEAVQEAEFIEVFISSIYAN